MLVGIERGDSIADVERLALKTAELRIFEDSEGRMNRSVVDIGGGALVVSQFTLCASLEKGRRPGFDRAAPKEVAQSLVRVFVEHLRSAGVPVAEGRFGETMRVSLTNEGPATFWLESTRGGPAETSGRR